ncbi:hypothetical protein PVL29_020822 [Vitis rotundifolia]|uniref:Uncharacterized protein n=1 Tax=Vitis rotundifolia TaxID=103349 RepID=A0AA39DC77_VITRO|nr:hypothetical protein PVL29_020822 [Vitis rotundifolia]
MVAAMTNISKGKKPMVSKNAEVHKKATFDRDFSLSEDSVLPYGMFITKIVKYFNVNLQCETDGKKLKFFDTYDWVSLRRMHFVSKKNGSLEKKPYVPILEVVVSSNDEASTKENENDNVGGRRIENENAIELPSNDGVGVKAIADHPSQTTGNEAKTSDNLNA